MLYREIKIVIILFVLQIFCSCKKELTREERVILDKDQAEIAAKTRINNYIFSKNWIGKEEYDNVVKKAKDSIENWIKNELTNYKYLVDETGNTTYELDTLFCFNKEKNKCISIILSMWKGENSGADFEYFYGIKIKKEWYFINPHLRIVLPRDYYYPQTFPRPFTNKELYNISGRVIYNDYLINSEIDKKTQISDDFFSDITNMMNCEGCKTQTERENSILDYIKWNWINKFVPLQKEEVVFQYDKAKKATQISFPIHLPPIVNIKVYGIAIRYWESLPTKEDEKEAKRLQYLQELEDRVSIENKWVNEDLKPTDFIMLTQRGQKQKGYTRTLTNTKPNTKYTVKITYLYNKGIGDGNCASFVTQFKTN